MAVCGSPLLTWPVLGGSSWEYHHVPNHCGRANHCRCGQPAADRETWVQPPRRPEALMQKSVQARARPPDTVGGRRPGWQEAQVKTMGGWKVAQCTESPMNTQIAKKLSGSCAVPAPDSSL